MDDQLRALLAVVDEGTFEAAAYELRVSPSAISQRIKALERRVGQVVVRRTTPARPTDAGRVLLAMARQMRLVEDDAMAALGLATGPRTLALAVPADSLATWFAPVLAAAAGWDGITLRLHVEDQDHSARLLRDGDVVGAVTSTATPLAGCRATPLGSMRYLPVAAPSLLAQHSSADAPRRSAGPVTPDLAALPLVRFNAKDDLQHTLLRRRGVDAETPAHLVPSSEGFAAAVRAGLGWGMLPEAQLGDDLDAGRLVRIADDHVDVVLHWQAWRLESARLAQVAHAVRDAARAGLRPA